MRIDESFIFVALLLNVYFNFKETEFLIKKRRERERKLETKDLCQTICVVFIKQKQNLNFNTSGFSLSL